MVLVVQAARAEDSPLAPEAPTVTLELPQEPELKYIDAEPLSLETAEPQLTALPHGAENISGGLLIPEITAELMTPVAAEPTAPVLNGEPSAANETIESSVQANLGE